MFKFYLEKQYNIMDRVNLFPVLKILTDILDLWNISNKFLPIFYWILTDLTEEEIKDKITNIKKNCFLLQLKNEVFENYLKRHDFGALRGKMKSNLLVNFNF